MLETKVIREEQDLTYLKWSHIRSSSGTAGTFLKSESSLGGVKKYYKLSNFDSVKGIVGHECVNELVVDRLLTILGVEHLHYELINARIEIEGKEYTTFLCASEDFKSRGESKTALDNYYAANCEKGESHYDFCVRMGWEKYIDTMLAVDYLILNRDRHGANIEVLRNAGAKTLRIAPMFDHGLSLLFPCTSAEEAQKYDVLEDKKCGNFIGTSSCRENLALIKDIGKVFPNSLKSSDRDILFDGLDGVLPEVFFDKMWEMIYRRFESLENLSNNR